MCVICATQAMNYAMWGQGPGAITGGLTAPQPLGLTPQVLEAEGVEPLGVLPVRGGGNVTLPGGRSVPSLTTEQAGAYITRDNVKWQGDLTGAGSGAFGAASVVSYSYSANAPSYMGQAGVNGFTQFTTAQIIATELSLLSWADVANITFVRQGSGTSGAGAYSDAGTIRFQNYSTGASGAAAFAYLPYTSSRSATAGNQFEGDVWVNSTLPYNINPQVFNYGFSTLTHEIGHALGLNHPGDYNGSGATTYQSQAEYFEDSEQYSLMSYWEEENTGANFGPEPGPLFTSQSAAPQLDDISAAQRLYGANMSTRTGNDTYGFNNTTGRPWYEATAGVTPIFAIWDAGGTDTLDFSGYSQNGMIDLRETAFSSVGGLVYNIAIARGAVIENAVGGSGSDTITGNAVANALIGGGGNDTLDGLNGNDTLDGGAGADTLIGGDGADFLFGGAGADVLDGSGGNDFVLYLEAAQGMFVESLAGGAYRVWQDLVADTAFNVELAQAGGVIYASMASFQAASFSSDFYLASNPGLIAPLDENNPFSVYQHYINNGRAEGRALRSFDALQYLASNPGLASLFGPDAAAGARHYVQAGFAEGRATNTFNGLDYAAAHLGLAQVFGLDAVGARLHYLTFGADEGRATSGFDTVAYWLSSNGFGGALNNGTQARDHWLAFGADEGRPGDQLFGREQATHGFSGGQAVSTTDFAGDRDWFVTSLTAGSHGVNLSGANQVLIYNAAGALIQTFGSGASAWVAPTAGTYYFVVVGGGGGSYTLAVAGASAPAAQGVGLGDAVYLDAMGDYQLGAFTADDGGWLLA